jgi:hypothetical protein
MAPPRKKRRAPGEGHPVHLRLPTDVFKRIEAKARAEGRPFNRVIINELASIPYLDRLRDFGEAVEDMKVVLARQSERIILADLGEPLLRAVDEILGAETEAEWRARSDRLRVLRDEMRKRGAKK